jgi:hypothetical protein
MVNKTKIFLNTAKLLKKRKDIENLKISRDSKKQLDTIQNNLVDVSNAVQQRN